MRTPTLAALLCFGTLPALAVPATSNLTLVTEAGFNEIAIRVDVPLIGADSDTSDLSGNVIVDLEIDPLTNQVSEMTVVTGSVTGTGVSFAVPGFFSNYNISSTVIGATLATPTPPGVVDPGTGNFDSSQHSFTVDSGKLTGSAYTLLTGTVPVDADFASAPVTGAGSGTGNVSLVLTGSTATTKTYDVTILIPVAIDDTFPATDTIDVAVTASGIVKASGTVTVPSTLYGIWTAENAIPEALFGDDANGDGVANGLQWALGLAAEALPQPHFLKPATGGFEIVLPAGGSAGVLTVLGSSDPATVPFVPVDPSAVSVGNPIPAGTTGTVTVDPGGASSGFLRLQASE